MNSGNNRTDAFRALLNEMLAPRPPSGTEVGDMMAAQADSQLSAYCRFEGDWLDVRIAQLVEDETDAASAWNAALDQVELGEYVVAILLFLLARFRAQRSDEFVDEDDRRDFIEAAALHACRAATVRQLPITAAILVSRAPQEEQATLRAQVLTATEGRESW